MPWIQLTLSCSEEHAPQVGDMLMANGAQAVTYRDGADTPIFEPPRRRYIVGTHSSHRLI